MADMLRVFRQPACILHVRAWRETSLLLECLSRDHGRVGLLARGARGRRRGIRGLLEPFQDLEVDFSGRGELRVLGRVEPVGVPRRLTAEALYSGLYLNEVLVRLLAREDPYPGLLERYQGALTALAAGDDLAWTVRCFERDFLATLGYAAELRQDALSGEKLDPDLEYVYVPEQGPIRWVGQEGLRLFGRDLLALANGDRPDAAGMARLRQLLRHLIRWHAPGAEPRSWRLWSTTIRSGAD